MIRFKLRKKILLIFCIFNLWIVNQSEAQRNLEFKVCDFCNQNDRFGNKTGLWIEDSGYAEVYYQNNRLNGISKTYYKINGTLESFGQYVDGLKSGTWYYFNENNHLSFIEKSISFNNKDKIKNEEGVYIKPMYKSYVIFYNINGNIKEEGYVIYDESVEIDFFKLSNWKYYNEYGVLIKEK